MCVVVILIAFFFHDKTKHPHNKQLLLPGGDAKEAEEEDVDDCAESRERIPRRASSRWLTEGSDDTDGKGGARVCRDASSALIRLTTSLNPS